MRKTFSPAIEAGRLRIGFYGTDSCDPDRGVFHARAPSGQMLRILMSSGSDWHLCDFPLPAWEHVSVSCPHRCPTWDEMCWVKEQFWNDDECVIQFHPPRAEYINNHNFCLHLWKPVGVEIPRPPAGAVGLKSDKERAVSQ